MTHEKVNEGASKASTVSAPCPQKLNSATIESLPVPERGHRIYYFGEATVHGVKSPRGFGLRVTANGARTFVVRGRVRGAGHADRVLKVGAWPDWKPVDAIKKARELRKDLDDGVDPIANSRATKAAAIAAAGDRFKAICESYLKREGGELRTGAWRKAQLERLVYPTLGDRAISDIKRSHIVKLLDTIEDQNGATMATATLAIIRKIFNWHAARVDDFSSPVVRGMARTNSRDQARSRILTDVEIRALWKYADEGKGADATFGRLLKFLLLTGARRSEAARMTWPELEGSDWTLPEARNKAKVDLVRPLSKAALAILPAKTGDCEYVFTTDGNRPIAGFSQFKSRVDDAIGVADWTLHDLRRSARSLMSRAGVQSDHAEQCLGHIIPGVRAVYDRHKYYHEKAEAYEKLALLIGRILDPAPTNVTQLRGA